MKKLLPFETPVNYFFEVVIIDPSDKHDYTYNLYTYIQDIDVVAAILNYSTKYEYTIRYIGTIPTVPCSRCLSINQAVAYFQRLRFYIRETVEREKTVRWTEVVEKEI